MPVIFRVKLGRTGNSLRITVPNPIVEGFGWKKGDEIVLFVTEQEVTLRKSVHDGVKDAAPKGPDDRHRLTVSSSR